MLYEQITEFADIAKLWGIKASPSPELRHLGTNTNEKLHWIFVRPHQIAESSTGQAFGMASKRFFNESVV